MTASLAPAPPLGTARFETVPYALLCVMDHARLDALPFGVVGLDSNGIVEVYNKTEAVLAGLNREDVIGAHFFLSIAQCMNNFLVAQRLEAGASARMSSASHPRPRVRATSSKRSSKPVSAD